MTTTLTTVADVLRLTGVTYRQLDHWTRRGYLKPQHDKGGSGVPRDWPGKEIRVAATIGRLTRAGVDVSVAARIARDHVTLDQREFTLAPGIKVEIETA